MNKNSDDFDDMRVPVAIISNILLVAYSSFAVCDAIVMVVIFIAPFPSYDNFVMICVMGFSVAACVSFLVFIAKELLKQAKIVIVSSSPERWRKYKETL
jgi:hypothetical protein